MPKINLTPTWSSLMPAFIMILENGTPEGKEEVSQELMRLAKEIDQHNAAELAQDTEES